MSSFIFKNHAGLSAYLFQVIKYSIIVLLYFDFVAFLGKMERGGVKEYKLPYYTSV